MKERLDSPSSVYCDVSKIGETLTFIRGIIGELKQFTATYKFVDEAEEIKFFKETKPVFLSQYYFYKKLFSIRLSDTFKDHNARQASYCKLLHDLEQFVCRNLTFYRYCIAGEKHQDKQYFTRNPLSGRDLNRDENFITGYDKKLAKILTVELLREFLTKLKQQSQSNPASESSSDFVWTSPKTDLVELIYALHAAGVFNKGNANIKTIAAKLEGAFNVGLGDYYRTFQDMRIRKRNAAPFLNHLVEKFLKRLDEHL